MVTKTIEKTAKTFFEDEFNEDMEKPISEIKEKYKKLGEKLDKDASTNTKVSEKILGELRNESIIEIITKEYVEDKVLSSFKKKREELKEKVKKEKGKRREVMLLHIDWLLSSVCFGFSRKIVNELINYLKEKDTGFLTLQTLIHKKIKLD